MNEAEKIAWCAGFLDADGSIQIARKRPSHIKKPSERRPWAYEVVVSVANTRKAAFVPFVELWGGKDYPTDFYRKQPRERAKQGHVYRMPKNSHKDALHAMLPYLRVKQERARVALEFIETLSKQGIRITDSIYLHRIRLFDRMRKLNKRGR